MNNKLNKLNVSRRPAQNGLTILELLISMVLGVTLMAGVVQVFVGMRQTDRTQESISRMQEAGRFALNFLAQDIRSSGYIGCSSTLPRATINSTLVAFPASFQPATGIQGWEANGTAPSSISNSANNLATTASNGAGWLTSAGNVLQATTLLPGTDVLRIWGADPDSIGVVRSITAGITPVINVTNTDLTVGDMVVLGDCQFADIIQPCVVAAVAGAPITANLSLSTSCAPGNTPSSTLSASVGAEVIKLSGNMYYVGKRGNVATNPPALFRRTLGNNGTLGNPEELVEGIENMQLLYGENTNSDSQNSADRYVPANLVIDWSNVVSVRISLLVQSIGDNLSPAPQSYVFNGVNYDGDDAVSANGDLPSDNRLRRVFGTTVNLRNRTL